MCFEKKIMSLVLFMAAILAFVLLVLGNKKEAMICSIVGICIMLISKVGEIRSQDFVKKNDIFEMIGMCIMLISIIIIIIL